MTGFHAQLALLAVLSPVVSIEAPPSLEGPAARVGAAVRGDFGPMLDLLGIEELGGPIRIVLAPDDSELAGRTPSWVSGFAVSGTGTIVLFPDRVPSYPDRNLEALVRHEVAHLAVHRAAGGHAMPRWFDEGVAAVAALEWGIEDRARYAAAVIGRGPESLDDLQDAFAGRGGSVSAAYAVSAAFVRHLQSAYGARTVSRILDAVESGLPFEEAFLRATGARLREAERDFFGREAFWRTWVPFLTSTTVLWAAITLLALVAIHRRRQRDRLIRERWEAEEELHRLAVARPVEAEDPAPGDEGRGDPRRFN